MKTNIVIPVKDFGCAKERLSGVLSERRRLRLARRMCGRTLDFFASCFPERHVLVVTASQRVAAMARQFGATVLLEPTPAGLSVAAQRAADWSVAHGFDSQLLIPADIAKLDHGEISRLLEHPRSKASVIICPSGDAGTNALVTTPPDVIPFSFGECSSKAHRELAMRKGVACTVLNFRHLRFDLDTSDDVYQLFHRSCCELSQELSAVWKIQ